uniref:L antigen family member 3 n=1 Tax=Hydra vulgaris TaxID=6087 RepID=T2MDS2_HYDVU
MEDKLFIYELELNVPFPTQRYAEIAYNTLRVDKEPSRGGCRKTISVNKCILTIALKAKEARVLRTASNSIFDHLSLIIETIDRFGPQVSSNS